MVPQRCDERGGGATSRGTTIETIEFTESAPKRTPARVPKDPMRRTESPQTTTERDTLQDKNIPTIFKD